MKKFFCLTFFTCIATFSFGQDAITKYFDNYMDDQRFTSVYISPKMFSMISKVDFKDTDPKFKEMMEVIKDLKGLRILTADSDDKQKVNGQQLYKEAMSKINTQEYEVLMTVRDKGDDVRFYTKEKDNLISELLLLTGSTEEFTLLSFIGNIDLQKIAKLGKVLNIEGAEHLDKLKK